MSEQWKKIEGYENYKVLTLTYYSASLALRVLENYKVSDDGQVYNTTTKKYLKGCVDKNGYVKIALSKDKKHKTFTLHRLVAQAFIENPEKKEIVKHRDNNLLDNDMDNLYWQSYEEVRELETQVRIALYKVIYEKEIQLMREQGWKGPLPSFDDLVKDK